jgi:tetratricopeptide (TPR) repeat protein
MRTEEEFLLSRLHQLRSDLLEGYPAVDEERRLIELFSIAELIQSSQTRLEMMSQFAFELARCGTQASLNPAKVETICRVAVRVIEHFNAGQAVNLALSLALGLERRADTSRAIALLDLAIDITAARTVQAVVWRAATAMLLRCLLLQSAYERAQKVVESYEADERRGTDYFELNIWVSGISCALMMKNEDAAVRCARLAIEIHQGGNLVSQTDSFLLLVSPPIPTATVYLAVGKALRQASRPLDAIDAFQQGRRYAIRESNALAAADLLSEIGFTWENVGEWDRGASILKKAAFEATQLGDFVSASRWQRGLATDVGVTDLAGFDGLAALTRLVQAGLATEKHEPLIKALIKQGKAQGSQLEPLARNLLTAFYSYRNKSEFALMASEAAVISAERDHSPWFALWMRINQAQLLFNDGQWRDARKVSDRVLEDAQTLWDEGATSEVRQVALAAASRVAEIALELSVSPAKDLKGQAWPTSPEAVLRIADRTRARNFIGWLSQLDWSRSLNIPELEKSIRALVSADLAVECATAQEGQPLKAVLERRKQAAMAVTAAYKTADVQSLNTSDLLSDFQLKLSEDSEAIDLSAIELGVVSLFAGGSRPQKVVLVPWTRSQRESWRERWSLAWRAELGRLGLSRDELGVLLSPGDQEQSIQIETSPTLEMMYEELHREFVKPLVDALSKSTNRLIVSLHSELSFIPLWALARARATLELSIVPSLRSICLLAKRPRVTGGLSISIGDATGSLSMAKRECELLTGFDSIPPTLAALVEAAPSARRLHFAGHGEIDAENPYLSGIVLNAPSATPQVVEASAFGCRRLTILGIFDKLDVRNCELATISACSVGSPRDHAASEFTSVPTAFLLAGARNVVAASWKVHDAAATVQMAYFHAALQGSKSIAAALATSRRQLAATSRAEATKILERSDVLPDGDFPFSSPLFTDAMIHFGLD